MDIVIERNPENKKMLSDLDGGTLIKMFYDTHTFLTMRSS